MRQTENISQIQTVSVFAENIISVKGMSDKNIIWSDENFDR